MDNLTTDRSFYSQATWVIDVLGFFDMLYMGVCTPRHWQTSGRLVQELYADTITLGLWQVHPQGLFASMEKALLIAEMAVQRAVVYYARSARAFSARIKCWHCTF